MRPYTSRADERYRDKVARWGLDHLAGYDDDAATDADAVALVRAMGAAGLLRAVVPRSDRAAAAATAAADTVRSSALCVAREELAHHSGLADAMYAMQGLGSFPIALAGGAALARRYLPEVGRGRLVAAFAITEENAGSDAAALATVARRDGRSYVLDGDKKFISNAGIADLYAVFAKTDPDAGHRGVSAFVVDGDNPGLKVTERTELNARHPIGRLRFDGCRVAATSRLGREGDGLKLAFRTLDTFRPTVGAAACGLARRALAETLVRVRQRSQFGRPLAKLQATRFRLADMATRLEAARGLVYRAAWLKDRGEPPTLTAAMAKLNATESAFRIVDDAVQLFGGDGVVRGAVVERLYREVRALRIYEGTSEIQRLVIARELLGE